MSKFLSESWLVLAMGTIFALLLAGAQAAFGPRIAENRRAELERAARSVVPAEVGKLEEATVQVEKEEKTVFKCLGAGGELVGWALVDSGFGFQDKIKLVVGLSPDGGKVTGLQVVENVETPGLGNRIEEKEFSDRYKGLDATEGITVVKQGASKDRNEIQAITGATISSEAVTRIANSVLSKVRPKLDELR